MTDDTTMDNMDELNIDVYAMGMLLCELWTRCKPFKELELISALKKVHDGERPTLIYKNGDKGVDPPLFLSNLIHRCWDNQPFLRPKVDEIQDRFLTGLSLLQRSKDIVGGSTDGNVSKAKELSSKGTRMDSLQSTVNENNSNSGDISSGKGTTVSKVGYDVFMNKVPNLDDVFKGEIDLDDNDDSYDFVVNAVADSTLSSSKHRHTMI